MDDYIIEVLENGYVLYYKLYNIDTDTKKRFFNKQDLLKFLDENLEDK